MLLAMAWQDAQMQILKDSEQIGKKSGRVKIMTIG
jgi:hypothetical protein